jgi:predicted enzyme related to lactoylglutathione lyase
MPRPVYFESPAEDPARSIAFYEKSLGWKFTKWEGTPHPYYMISTGEGPGIDGGLMLRHDPSQPCTNTMSVTDIDASAATIEAAGGVCALPKMAIPTVGWLAYYKDPDGHIFGIMQPDPEAK